MSDLVKRSREMLAKITPGPWTCWVNGEDNHIVTEAHGFPAREHFVANAGRAPVTWTQPEKPQALHNSRFIAAAPELVSALADEVEALRGYICELRRDCDKLRARNAKLK